MEAKRVIMKNTYWFILAVVVTLMPLQCASARIISKCVDNEGNITYTELGCPPPEYTPPPPLPSNTLPAITNENPEDNYLIVPPTRHSTNT